MNNLISINPSTYEKLGSVPFSTEQDIQNAVLKAHKAKLSWKELGVTKRVELLRPIFAEILKQKQALAEIQSKEMGMPINDALYDVDDSVNFAHWYLDHGEEYLTEEITFENEKEIHYVIREPIGVTAAILPWNFPFANFVWGCVQSLICGNVIVMKHSEECPLSSQFIERIVNKYLPEGVFNVIYGDGKTGDILTDQHIDMITFTGSTKTGKYLYEKAGKKFINAVMELGGSAPGIIFEDADISTLCTTVCDQRLFNAGQCCDGLKRLIVHESVAEKVISKLKELFEAKKIGDALDSDTSIGPLVAKRQLDVLIKQVEDALQKGAKVVTGGKSLEKELGGAFYSPTILTNITNDMNVWTEEVFGPVLPIMTFKTEEEAIKLANDTSYGLGSYVYTASKERMKRVAEKLETGMVGFNGVSYIKPFNPFGGYKHSGLGREHGKYGFHELTQIKVIARPK